MRHKNAIQSKKRPAASSARWLMWHRKWRAALDGDPRRYLRRCKLSPASPSKYSIGSGLGLLPAVPIFLFANQVISWLVLPSQMQPTSKESPPGGGTRSNAIMDAENAKRSDARSQAEDRFAKITRRDAEVRAYQQQQWDDEAAKIAKLRALRLAKEAETKSRPVPKRTAHAAHSKTAKPV